MILSARHRAAAVGELRGGRRGFAVVRILHCSAVTRSPHAVDAGLVSNIMIIQIRVGILFPLFVVLAIMARRKDPETHKRLMIPATVLPLPAAINRIEWLPRTLPDSPGLAGPVRSAVDYCRCSSSMSYGTDASPRAYVIWLTVSLPFVVATELLWGTPWWLATAPKLVGLAGQ
jgi:hypothetical protein